MAGLLQNTVRSLKMPILLGTWLSVTMVNFQNHITHFYSLVTGYIRTSKLILIKQSGHRPLLIISLYSEFPGSFRCSHSVTTIFLFSRYLNLCIQCGNFQFCSQSHVFTTHLQEDTADGRMLVARSCHTKDEFAIITECFTLRTYCTVNISLLT